MSGPDGSSIKRICWCAAGQPDLSFISEYRVWSLLRRTGARFFNNFWHNMLTIMPVSCIISANRIFICTLRGVFWFWVLLPIKIEVFLISCEAWLAFCLRADMLCLVFIFLELYHFRFHSEAEEKHSRWPDFRTAVTKKEEIVWYSVSTSTDTTLNSCICTF